MDEELAEFTDKTLMDQPVEESGMNDQLHSLTRTISRLKAAMKTAPPEGTMARIEKQLINEWHKNQNAPEKKPSFWQKLRSGFPVWQNQPQRWPVLALVLTVFFLIVISPITGIITSDIQGSAGSSNQYQVILFIVAVILVVGLLWLGRNKS
jgi:hypothetical protein